MGIYVVRFEDSCLNLTSNPQMINGNLFESFTSPIEIGAAISDIRDIGG
jgi:hypothetical protein